MRNFFDFCCDYLNAQRQAEEHYLLGFEGEQSDFVRLNHSSVRQAGSVHQATIDLRLIKNKQHIAGKISLSGDALLDKTALQSLLNLLRDQLNDVPEDPYLLYSTDDTSSEIIQKGLLPDSNNLIEHIAKSTQGKDLVGIYAAGPIYRGFASSFGSRRWHQTETFNIDYSLYLSGDKAVKSRYVGFEWNDQEFQNKIHDSIQALEILRKPSITLQPGKFRAYLAPAALAEVMTMLAWDSFGIKAQKTRRSALLRLMEGFDEFHPILNIREDIAGGISANFDSAGFAKPKNIHLIENGKLKQPLVSPRSAMEFNIPTTGANSGESPEALEVFAGNIANSDILQRLGTGIYINNLWYLNYSDHSAGKLTGMTRFATFWVEKGEIVSPVNVMRFDESIYRLLGSNLEGFTQTREYLIDPSSYGARSTQTWNLPGALVKDFALTL